MLSGLRAASSSAGRLVDEADASSRRVCRPAQGRVSLYSCASLTPTTFGSRSTEHIGTTPATSAHRLHRAPHARRAHFSSSSRSRSLHAFCSTSTRTSSPRRRALEECTMLSASLQSLRLRSSSITTTSSSYYPQSLLLQLGLRVLSVLRV